jgi:hypothetical protein
MTVVALSLAIHSIQSRMTSMADRF